MKTKKKNILLLLCLTFVFVLCFGTLIFPTTNICNADVFLDVVVPEDDNGICMRMTANNRKKNVPLQKDVRKVSTNNGEISYYCFNWRELESLSFAFSSNSQTQCLSHKFKVSYMKSEKLQSIFGGAECQTEILYDGQAFSNFDFFYYVDSNQDEKNTQNSRSGHDFGLYKFDFSFTQEIDGVILEISIGEIYVAVFADDIDSINIPINTQIIYSISSSNKLLNVFNLYLSTDVLKYVNPQYLTWEVVGQDENEVHYCLDKHMQEKMEYGSYQLVWPSYLPTESFTGSNFKFDSNDIEGTWTVMLTVKNTDGTIKSSFRVDNLSTIKVEKPSYLWLILLIVFLVFAIVATIIFVLFIVRKKKEKVW